MDVIKGVKTLIKILVAIVVFYIAYMFLAIELICLVRSLIK